MLQRAVALALTLTTIGLWSSSEAARAQSTPVLSPWQRIDSQHFEIHYLPALAPELDRVVRGAERAYDRISGQLDFVFPTKVPLVITLAAIVMLASIVLVVLSEYLRRAGAAAVRSSAAPRSSAA